MKCPYHTDSSQIFPCQGKHFVQMLLHLLIHWHCQKHNPEYHNTKERNHTHKNKGSFYIHCKCHDHGTKYNKRRTQQQTQCHIDPRLYLIHITGQPRDQSRCSYRINLCIGQALNMAKQRLAKLRGNTYCCLRRKILGNHRRNQTYNPKKNHHTAHFIDIR